MVSSRASRDDDTRAARRAAREPRSGALDVDAGLSIDAREPVATAELVPASVPPPAVAPPPPRAAPLPPTLAPPPEPPPEPRSEPAGSLDAVPSLAKVDVSGPLQDAEIRRALERVLPAVRDCYRDAARSSSRTPRIDVRVGFEIDTARAARNVRTARASLAGLAACVGDAVGRARTRVAPDVGNARVVVVITFTPTRP